MKEDININDKLESALDITNEGRDVTDVQLDLVKDDGEVAGACRELLRLKAATRMAGVHIDVERRLKDMHRRMANARRRRLALRVSAAITAAAAVFTGLLFIVNRHSPTSDGNLYTATEDKSPVMIANDDGDEQPLRPTATQSYTISMSDYRKVLSDDEKVERVSVSVPDGNTANINLPDGSIVMLQPGSRLRFPSAFAGKDRLVILEGEAYFKVRHDAARPFIVQAGGIETTVLGTEFNVKDNTVTLVSGRVRVSGENVPQPVIITPGHSAILANDRLQVAEADTLPLVYRRDGYLYYDNMTIGDIMKALGHTYNMTVRCNNTSLINQRMRFIAERDKGIDEALVQMNRMGKIRVYRKENIIYVN